MHCFLIGICGTGMSALALALRARGHTVSGSDRSVDQGEVTPMRARLEADGITLHPQDGSGPNAAVDRVITSAAIEDGNPDLISAQRLNLPLESRADALADLVNAQRAIAISGTSGKSTITGMVGWMLHATGHDPGNV